MKTIEEAAILHIYDCIKEDEYDRSKLSFKKGVEFAQRWITVEEDKPQNRDVVLAKIPMINYPLLFSYNQVSSKWFQFYDGDFYESEIFPTHWRPIELK